MIASAQPTSHPYFLPRGDRLAALPPKALAFLGALRVWRFRMKSRHLRPNRRNLNEFASTDTLDNDIAALAKTGESSQPVKG